MWLLHLQMSQDCEMMEPLLISILMVLAPVIIVYWWLMRRTISPPRVMSLKELEAEGMTKQQAREEQRKQRKEHRDQTYVKGYSTRTGIIGARFWRMMFR